MESSGHYNAHRKCVKIARALLQPQQKDGRDDR